MALGGLVGGKSGMLIAFVVALGTNAFSLWNADTMVLRMYGAQEVDERREKRSQRGKQHRRLHVVHGHVSSRLPAVATNGKPRPTQSRYFENAASFPYFSASR